MKRSYSEELIKSTDIYLELLKKLEAFDYEKLTPAFSKAINDSSELMKKDVDEQTNKIEALGMLSVTQVKELYNTQEELEEAIKKAEESLGALKGSTRYAYSTLIKELPSNEGPAYLAEDYEKTRNDTINFLSETNEQVDFILNKISRKTVIINYDFNKLVLDARESLLKKNAELSEQFPEFTKALEARPIGGVPGGVEKNIIPFIYELRNRIELIQDFFNEQDAKLQKIKNNLSPKLAEKESEIAEYKKKLQSIANQLEENDKKDEKATEIFAELSDKYLEILPPIIDELYKDPAFKEYQSLLDKLNISVLSGFSFMNMGALYQLGALLCSEVAPVDLNETFSVVCRNKYTEIISDYIATDEHHEADKAFCTTSNPNKKISEHKEETITPFETETEAGKKGRQVKEYFKKLHSLPECLVFKKEFLEKLKAFVCEADDADLIDVFEHFGEEDINNSLDLAKEFVSFKTLYRATPEQKIAIDNEYYQSKQAETTNETCNSDSDFRPYTTLSQSDLEDLQLERIEREARQAREAAERAEEEARYDRERARRQEERDRQEALREQMRAQSAANMRCGRCANHDACGNSRGVINCGAFTPKLKY